MVDWDRLHQLWIGFSCIIDIDFLIARPTGLSAPDNTARYRGVHGLNRTKVALGRLKLQPSGARALSPALHFVRGVKGVQHPVEHAHVQDRDIWLIVDIADSMVEAPLGKHSVHSCVKIDKTLKI